MDECKGLSEGQGQLGTKVKENLPVLAPLQGGHQRTARDIREGAFGQPIQTILERYFREICFIRTAGVGMFQKELNCIDI